ncbi:MAG: hypothetical protein ABIH26_12320 [Candidatus Eisenbacteria bacterium]
MRRISSAALAAVSLALLAPAPSRAAAESVGFDSPRWVLANAEVVEHLGRKALTGFAYLDGFDFGDGVIEVEIAVDGRTSYPGIVFRLESPGDYEQFYIRPHRAPLNYGDALQYAPSINGIGCWQLFNGEGYTANADIPRDEWVPVRAEIRGEQARFFVGSAEKPSLVVTDLKRGAGRGTIGVLGPRDGTAYFSEFRYETDVPLPFDPPPLADRPAGMITDWELSREFRYGEVDLEKHPREAGIDGLDWRKAESDPSGLVNIALYAGRSGREPDCVYARAVIRSDRAERRRYVFGYSDLVSVFLNGEPLFTGSSPYRGRDPSFLGILGLHDSVFLPLREGENEILLLVAEAFGGWGFVARDAEAVFLAPGVREAWSAGSGLRTPESAVYDPTGQSIYVSNYDIYTPSRDSGLQCVSRLNLDGSVAEERWAEGLRNPTGMAIRGSRLFVVERGGIAEIDLSSGEVAARREIPGARFPNDVAIAPSGELFVSDTEGHSIYRLSGGAFEEWMSGGEIMNPNALFVRGGELLVGNNGDRTLKAIDLGTGRTRTLARLGPGIIDGIQQDAGGDLLVSHWEGRVFRVKADGTAEKILDTTALGRNCADFAYVPGRRWAVIPTFADNGVDAYEIRPD